MSDFLPQTGADWPLSACGAAECLPRLMSAAEGVRLLSADDIFSLQQALAALLADRTSRYTQGESSSVTKETAENLLHSLLFCIGLSLKASQRAKNAAEKLRQVPLAAIWEEGCAIAQAMKKQARHIWLAAKGARIKTPNRPYQYTLLQGISPFFTFYDPVFAAQDVPSDIDYPLNQSPALLEGVEYMHAYLSVFLLENRFLQKFSATALHRCMCRCAPTYETLPINLFEQALRCALGCLFSAALPAQLCPNAEQIKAMEPRLCAFPQSLPAVLGEQTEKLFDVLQIRDAPLKTYMRQAAGTLLPAFEAAAASQNLSHFFLV